MNNPQRGGVGRMIGHDDMLADIHRERTEQLRTVDRIRPWLRFGQLQSVTLLTAIV